MALLQTQLVHAQGVRCGKVKRATRFGKQPPPPGNKEPHHGACLQPIPTTMLRLKLKWSCPLGVQIVHLAS